MPDGPYDPVTTEACGTTLTISDKINKVESRTREDDKGNVRTDNRGTYIVRVTAPDGRKVVLDNSVRTRFSSSRTEALISRCGRLR